MPCPYLTLTGSWKAMPHGVNWSKPEADGTMSFLAPLDIGGVTVGSFALRGTCNEDRSDRDVMLQLEIGIAGQRTRLPLVRIDWRPLSGGHKNPAHGPAEHRSRFIAGTHVHTLELNWLEDMQRMRETNLPFAIAVADPSSYVSLLDYAKNLFRINGLDQLPTPEWSAKLV